MTYFRVIGGRPLRGSVPIQGSKNAVLPILAAALAARGRCEITGCPDIRDVHTMLALLRGLGCEAELRGHSVFIDATDELADAPDEALAGQMRASVLLLGALLTARGSARIPLPGGCALGARPLDLHLRGLEALGASPVLTERGVDCRREGLRGGTALLRYPSVGATENLMLAALGANEPVTIVGAAKEPEIAELARFLQACGAEVQGAGGSVLRVRGGTLHGCRFALAPDRMDAATWLCAGAATGGTLRLERARASELEPLLRVLAQAGCEIGREADALTLRAGELRAVPPVATAPYPGFPTDAQAPLMAALLKAGGVSVFHETVFEDRFRHVPALRRTGAQIEVAGTVARVRGVRSLHGADMEATDLRGGAAMLIAALSCEGESRIFEVKHLLRGYERLPERLALLGAAVTEEDTEGSG